MIALPLLACATSREPTAAASSRSVRLPEVGRGVLVDAAEFRCADGWRVVEVTRRRRSCGPRGD